MATPSQVSNWDVAGLAGLAADATALADAIAKAADTMHTTIHDGLVWKGAAKDAAEGKADREQKQMRAVATAYDDIAAACSGAHDEMAHPLSEIKTILQLYAVAPVAVADDWTITGVEDWNSDAGQQLSRLSGLVATLVSADVKWSAKLSHARHELAMLATDSALKTESAEIQKIKKEDPKAIADSIATNPTSFWAPDVPGMTASTIAGAMTEGTRLGLENAAKDAGDAGVLKWVENWGNVGKDGTWARDVSSGFSRLGVVGSAIGTVPSIVDDIHGGMDPTEAVVSEGGGTAAGLLAGGVLGGMASGAVAGTELGSVVPGVGNVVGLVVGSAVGAGASYLGSKGIQWLWE